jgi:uncharacterized membrane protein YwaF
MRNREGRTRSSSAAFGLVIMGVGVLLLLDRVGSVDVESYWRLWPLGLVILGIGQLARPAASRNICWGATLMLLGIGYLCINYEVLGLDWSNAWPLALVALGIGLVLDALFGQRREAR